MINALMLVLLCQFAAVASAQPASPPANHTPPSESKFFSDLGIVGTKLKEQVNKGLAASLLEAGLKIAVAHKTWALYLGGGLALVALAVEGINILTSRTGSLSQALADVLIPVAFCAFLLQNYEEVFSRFASENGLLQMLRDLGGDITLGVGEMYAAIFDMIAGAIASAWTNFGEFSFPSWAFVGSIMDLFLTGLFAVLVIIICLGGLAEIIGLILMGPFLGAVAIAFGPLFIATLAAPFSRDYFGKWLGFLVASAVLTGVMGVCIGIATTIFQSFDFNSIVGSNTPSALRLLLAAVLIMAVNSLIQQAPGIANALVPGSVGIYRGSGDQARHPVNAYKTMSRLKVSLKTPAPPPPPAGAGAHKAPPAAG